MVTTFNPPARPKQQKKKPKPKPPTALIGLGVASAVLLIIVFILLGKSGAANERADMLSESVVEVAGIVGATNVTAESLGDAEAAPESLEAVRVAVDAAVTDLETASTELEQSQADVTRIQGELAAAEEATSDAESKASSASSDLNKRSAELSELQGKYDADVAGLNEEIEDLKAQLMAATKVEEEVMEEDDDAEEMDEEPMEESAVSAGKPESSKYFTSFKYDTGKSNLTIRAKGGKSIKFMGVPEEIYTGLSEAPVFDLYYRFKLMDVYESKPDAREFIINLKD